MNRQKINLITATAAIILAIQAFVLVLIAIALLAVLPLWSAFTSCSGSGDDGTIHIYSSLPLQGPDREDDLTIVNSQYLPDGTLDPNRLTPRTAGFGAATNAQPLRNLQLQVRFQF